MEHFTGQFISTLVALAFVCALAFGSLLLLRRFQQGRGASRPHDRPTLRFLSALQLGAKERLVVLNYRGEEWVVGVSAGAVTLLSRSSAPANAEVRSPDQRAA